MAAMYCGMLTISNGTPVGGAQVFGSSRYALPIKRNAGFRVRSTTEGKEVGATTNQGAKSPAPVSTPPPPPPPPRKVQPSFRNIFAFGGPGPERINGRLAMIGFVAAMGVELANGQDLFSQVQDGGVSWFVLTSGLLTAASLIPLFQGVSVESKSDGVMTSDAELWNGRFAMLGLVALALTEFVKGGALV